MFAFHSNTTKKHNKKDEANEKSAVGSEGWNVGDEGSKKCRERSNGEKRLMQKKNSLNDIGKK
jgi:hypothetical protein